MSIPHVKGHPQALPAAWDSQVPSPDGAWLTPLAGHWIEAACKHLAAHPALVRVTVTALRGSAPREPGASLLVHALGTVGTIGGGRLEWHAMALARELLLDIRAPSARTTELILGPELGQCCGGRVELWLERLTRRDLPWLEAAARRLQQAPDAPGVAVLASELADRRVTHRLLRRSSPAGAAVQLRRGAAASVTLFEVLRRQRPPLWIFGAGHVGQALVRLLAQLALFEITWVDPRAELLPADLPEGVRADVCAHPAERVASAPTGTRFVVLTHDHALDFELCRLVLSRADSAWLGLIGSASKAARFRSRLLRAGLDREAVARLDCPIGVGGISSKQPVAIAIAIAAQLLQQMDAKTAPTEAPSATQAVSSATDTVASAGARSQECTGNCDACGAHPHGKA